jgi:hypothetical protein
MAIVGETIDCGNGKMGRGRKRKKGEKSCFRRVNGDTVELGGQRKAILRDAGRGKGEGERAEPTNYLCRVERERERERAH